MGASYSTDLRKEELEEFESSSHFSQKDIKRLYKRFKNLDMDDSGTITASDFSSIPELAMNPLLPRITAVFGIKGDDHVNFKQFITVLSAVAPSAPKEEKVKCAFKVYDVNEDGFITQDELFSVLKLMVGKNLSDEQLQNIARTTLQRADKDKDGKISPEEFGRIFENNDIENKLQIHI